MTNDFLFPPNAPNKMRPSDPAYWMLEDSFFSIPTIYSAGCYICRDPEYAQMGMPLCYACKECGHHVAADDPICVGCRHECFPGCGHYDLDGHQLYVKWIKCKSESCNYLVQTDRMPYCCHICSLGTHNHWNKCTKKTDIIESI